MNPALVLGVCLLAASATVFALVRVRLSNRPRKGMAWSDNSPKQPFSHNLDS
jgi:hypothetical protein